MTVVRNWKKKHRHRSTLAYIRHRSTFVHIKNWSTLVLIRHRSTLVHIRHRSTFVHIRHWSTFVHIRHWSTIVHIRHRSTLVHISSSPIVGRQVIHQQWTSKQVHTQPRASQRSADGHAALGQKGQTLQANQWNTT